ncbi:MAG: hypothetical protein HYZ28_24000 [Myxococcales bacterium]|nr:hypothetical protein [Myxococcales bacterium]
MLLWAGVCWAEDHSDLGDSALDRRMLQNFHDFEEVTLEELLGEGDKLRFSMNVFGSAGFSLETPAAEQFDDTFATGALGLLFTANLGSSITALAELAVEADASNAMFIDPERLNLRWSNKSFSLTAGKMHTELGYWNTAYHHGVWLEPSIERPRIIRFEDDGGMMQAHAVGLLATWNAKFGPGTFNAAAGAMNGRGHGVDDVQFIRDNNREKALLLSAYYQDLGLPGLRVGGGALYDRIAPAPASLRPSLPGAAISELILNANVVYRGRRLLVIAEWFGVFHRAAQGQWSVSAPYLLVGYSRGHFLPYAMVEFQDRQGGDSPFFVPDPDDPGPTAGGSFIEGTVGVRYETSNWSSLKAEYRLGRELSAGPLSHSVGVSWSFGI